ncbi:hypothetical protein K7432_007551 [Basidiobolus ranarum]|uniref:G protein-coupled receptor n=1 Tax=Basidiobolus ranarum TaxID=34480 RepID=A0ABR2WT73_9FUNG
MFNWTVFTTFNTLSIVCSLIMVSTILGLWLYQRKLVERISFRLVGLCAICDVLRHTFRIIQIYTHEGSLDRVANDRSSLFQISSIVAEMALLIFILYTFEIILNLQLVLLHQVRIMINHQIIYFIIPPTLVLLITLISVFAPPLSTSELEIKVLTASILLIFSLVLIYTLVVCILIVIKLVRTTRAIIQFNPFGIPNPEKNGPNATDNDIRKATSFSSTDFLARKAVRQAIVHILMYPVAMMAVGFPTMIVRVIFILSPVLGIEINLDWEEYSNSLQGVVNFACFLFDPALGVALRSIKRDLLANYSSEKSTGNSPSSTSVRGLVLWCTERFILKSPPVSSEEEAHTLILANNQFEQINSSLIECENVTNKIKHL